jgi:fatty-acyl-CoA synthase
MQATMMHTPLSINGFLERAGSLFPRSEIVSRLPNKSLVTHSFAQYQKRTLALADALTNLGLKKGDRVATLCWNHHAHLECYFGIPAAGGVMHTLNLRLSAEEIGWIAGDAQDRFLIVDDVLWPLYQQFASAHAFEKVIVFNFSGAFTSGTQGSLDYEQLLANARPDFIPVAHAEDDPIAMCYTSGTTGRPKGVVYSHRSTVLHSLVACMPDFWGLSGRDVILPVTPMFHANCWGIPYAAVMLGARMVFPGPHLHPEDLLDLMQIEPPTMSLGVPTIWLTLIQTFEASLATHPGKWRLPKNMRSLVGGSAVPESLIRLYAKHGVFIAQGWGMTETSPLASMFYKKPALEQTEDQWFARRATAGMPAPLVSYRLMTEDGPAAWNGQEVGEIQVQGPFITGGYHGVATDPDKFTSDGWLRTGDVGAIDTEGYLRIADRTKDLIKSGGEWISSVDLENAIMAHPAVAEAAVIAIPDPKWAERPLACVVLKPGNTLSTTALTEFLAPKFAKWQLPDEVRFIQAIPRTSTGKFWKAKLREMHAQNNLPLS